MRPIVTNRTNVPLAIFLGALAFFGLTWRLSFVVTDNWTLANTVLAVADGHLHLTDLVYGPDSGAAPGTHLVDGRLYGRNYGQVALAVPVLWALRGVTAAVDVTLALAVAWSALLFGFATAAGDALGRRRQGAIVGGAVAVAALAANAALAGPVDARVLPLLALQIVTAVAAALTAVVVYELVDAVHGSAIGAAAGAAVVLATPVSFWATIPKRHSLTALFAVLALYCFYRSRAAPTVRQATRLRALSYVPVGLATWVHAPEGLVLFVALGTVDFFTARSNRPRHLALVGAVFLLSLAPFFLTNTLIAGNPLEPPRALPGFEGEVVPAGQGEPSATGGGGGSGLDSIPAVVATGLEKAGVFLEYTTSSAAAAAEPGRLFDVFVRSGHGLGLHRYGARPVNLSVLESMPVAGVLLAAPLVLWRRLRHGAGPSLPAMGPARATDVLAVAYLSLLAVVYLPRLPIHVSFTVRYLHPLFPICVYFLARLRIVRRVVRAESGLLVRSYLAAVLVGGPLFVAVLATSTKTVGEAVQVNAGLALAAAAVLLYWGALATVYDGYERFGAGALGVAAAVTTAFLLLSAVAYFPYGSEHAVALVRAVADRLALFPAG